MARLRLQRALNQCGNLVALPRRQHITEGPGDADADQGISDTFRYIEQCRV